MNGKYKVVWRRHLIDIQLARFVVTAMQRGESVAAITAAMNEIDRLLSENPQRQGESRPNFERILIASPLAVDFEVHEGERIVYVLRARYAPKRSLGG
jgi:hypothetical protein